MNLQFRIKSDVGEPGPLDPCGAPEVRVEPVADRNRSRPNWFRRKLEKRKAKKEAKKEAKMAAEQKKRKYTIFTN